MAMNQVKMVVTGPFSSGKTEFISSISEIDVVKTERTISSEAEREVKSQTTVAMDFGRITITDDIVLYLFGTPGQERFSFMWETLSEGMLGFVLLVDATSPQSVEDARSMIEFFKGMAEVPFVVAANKVDAEDAEALDLVRTDLGLDASVPLLPVDARDRESVKAVLIGLLNEILKSMD